MDRRDLKEGQEVYVKGRVIHTGDHLDIVLGKGSFIENAIILHHEKPVIPQFVADWIEVCKDNLTHSLYTAMTPNFMKENGQSFDLILWIKKSSNQETFARAWLDGYDVEQEKRYKAVLPNLYEEENVLHFSQEDEVWYFNNDFNDNVSVDKDSRYHTRKELEDAGFGWVFDCEGVEVQEVE